MLTLAQNSVIRIDAPGLEGLYRIVAEDPRYPETYLSRLREASQAESPKRWSISLGPMARACLETFYEAKQLELIELQPAVRHIVLPKNLKSNERKSHAMRLKIIAPFLNHQELARSLYLTKGIGPLVKQVVREVGCARSTVYSLFGLLCQFGFDAGALNPRFDLCGAPGKKRPVGPGRKKPGRKSNAERLGVHLDHIQPGCGEEWFAKVLAADGRIRCPKPRFSDRYQIIIQSFSPGYRHAKSGVEHIPPAMGSYPNKRQVRYILDQYPELIR